jgi:hypothetical protein
VARLEQRDRPASRALGKWLATILDDFDGRILPIDSTVADQWGRLDATNPLSTPDGLIAATAIANGMTIVTRDADLIARPDVPTINPFEAA